MSNLEVTRIFFDTEFTGLHQNTSIISIGLVADIDEKYPPMFYAEFDDYDVSQLDDWIRENVISNLWIQNPDMIINEKPNFQYVIGNTDLIVSELEKWLSQFISIEMWSDCLAYDWVLFCQLFGHAFNIPKNIYKMPFDICTLLKHKGIDPDTNREKLAEMGSGLQVSKHNALWNALVIKACYGKLIVGEANVH